MANTIDDLLALTTTQTTLITSLQTFVSGLQAQLAALPGITPDQQTEINTMFGQLTADNAALTAITANTPVATPPVTTPTVSGGTGTDTTVGSTGTDTTPAATGADQTTAPTATAS